MAVVFTIAAFLCVLLLPITATADSTRDKDGQYFCVVEHVAGINFSHEGQNRVVRSGSISLPDTDMKFFIKIGPKQYDDTRRGICATDLDYWYKLIEQGMPVSRPNTVDESQWIGLNCFTSSEVTWTSLDGKRDYTFQGYGGILPVYYGADPATWLAFDPDNSFTMGFGYDEGPVVEYGHCTKIEPPK